MLDTIAAIFLAITTLVTNVAGAGGLLASQTTQNQVLGASTQSEDVGFLGSVVTTVKRLLGQAVEPTVNPATDDIEITGVPRERIFSLEGPAGSGTAINIWHDASTARIGTVRGSEADISISPDGGQVLVAGDLAVSSLLAGMTYEGDLWGRTLNLNGSRLSEDTFSVLTEAGKNLFNIDTANEVITINAPVNITGPVTAQNIISNVSNNQPTEIPQELLDHLEDTSNPHETTAAQVGALSLTGGTVVGNTVFNANLTVNGTFTATNLAGNGSGITNIQDSALSSNVALLNRDPQTFTGANTFSAAGTALTVTNTASIGTLDVSGQIQAGSGNVTITTATGNIDADAIGLITGDGAGVSSSGSGLETDGDRLGLLQGCGVDQILKWNDGANLWACATDLTGGGGATLQGAYDAGSTINTSESRDIDIVLADETTTESNLDIDIEADNTVSISRLDNAITETPPQLLLLENLDTNLTIADGISIQAAVGGVITDALDVSDPRIVNAINIGANDILSNGTAISSAELNLLDGHDVALVDTNDAVNTAITGTGALNSGSITSGFGTIDNADTITGTTINGTTGINTGAGAGTQRIDSSGNLVSIGNLSSVAAITISSTGAGNDIILNSADIISFLDGLVFTGVASDITTAATEDLTLSAGTTGVIELNDTIRIPTLDSTAGSTALCRNASNLLAGCSSNPNGVTLQQAYVAGNTIDITNAEGNLLFNLADATNDNNVRIDNTTTGDVATAFQVTTTGTGATIGTALDVSDTDIGAAINIGLNDILSNGVTISSAELNLLDGHDVALVDTNDAVSTAITGTGALNSGSITSGFGTIDNADTITGTTLNGTTGINTGVGAGTQRIDSTGNLVNIGNLTATGEITIASTGAGNDIILNSADIISFLDGLVFSGVASDITTAATEDLTLSAGTTGAIELNDTVRIPTLDSTAGSTLICRNASNLLAGCTSNPSGVTLQQAYDSSTSPEIVLDATRGALTIRDNATPLGANLFEVQNNAGGTTYFNVTATGVSVTGTTTSSGNINSTGGTIQTNSINRIDNTGNLVNIGNITGTGAITIASTGAGNDIIINGADILDVQDAAVFSSTLTANADVTFSDGAAGDTITIGDSLVATQDTVNIQGDINIGTDTDADAIAIGSGSDTVTLTGNASSTFVYNGVTVDVTEFNVLDAEITLGTETAGNYVDNVTGGAGITVTGSAGEGWEPDVTLDLLDAQDGTSGTTFSFSGLEFQGASSDEVTLLQGCADGQILKWDDEVGGNGRWDCADDNAGAGSSSLQTAYDTGNVINTSEARDIDIVLADETTTESNLDIDIEADNTVTISRLNNAVTEATAQLLLLENLDTDLTVATGLLIQSTGASRLTTGVDVSDAEIDNAISIGDNTILGGAAVINFSDFDVASTGQVTISDTTDITTPSGEHLTLTAAGAGNIELSDTVDVGANTIQGTSAVINFSDFDVASTGQVTISDTTDITTPAGEDLTLLAGTTGVIDLNDTVRIPTLDGTAGSTALCRNASNLLAGCTTNANGVTLQQAYVAGNTIDATSGEGNIAFTLTSADFTTTIADGSTNTVSISRADGAGAVDPAQLLLLDNLDTTRAVPIGLKIQAAAGTITTAIDLTDTEIGTGISLGANDITGTSAVINFSDFDVASTGQVTISDTTDITTPSGENLTLTAAGAGVIELADTVDLGTNTLQGTTAVINFSNFDVASSGQITLTGVATDITTGSGEDLTLDPNGAGNLVVVGLDCTGNLSGGALTANASGVISCSDDDTGGGSGTLQNAYDNSSNPAVVNLNTSGKNIQWNLQDLTADPHFIINTESGSTGQTRFLLADGTGTTPPNELVLIENQDTNLTLANGITIQAATGGAITDGIDLTDAEITNAVNVGDNTILGTGAVIDFSDFDVASTGQVTISDTTDITTPSGENLTLSAGGAGVIELADTVDVGANTIQGTTAVINFSDFDVASTGQVTISDTTDITTPAGEDLTFLAGTTGVIELNDTVRIPTLDGTAGSTALCRNASNLLAGCTSNANGVTLQQAYEAGNTINATTGEGAIAFTLTSADFTTTVADGSSNIVSISRANGVGTADPAELLLLDNLDLDRAVPIGLKIQSAAGTITTAIDLTDTEIGTGISLGANDITGTSAVINFSDFDVASTGQVTISDTTDITTPSGEHLTLSAAGAGNIELSDTVDVGANTIQGTAAVINFSDFDVASTGQVTVSDTTDITTPAGEDLTLLAGTTGVIDLNDTVRIPTLDGTAGATALCRNASNLLAGCTANANGVTLQQAYEAGNTINATTAEGAIAFTLTSADFTTTIADGSTNTVSISRADGAGTADPAQLLLLDNLDTNRTVPIGLKIQAAAGTITTSVDLTDTEIGTGIALGANDITGTSAVINFDNFDVASTGGITIGDDTTDITTPAGEDLTLTAGTTGVISLNDTVSIPTLDGTDGATALCRDAGNLLAGCSGSGGTDPNVTLQNAYVNGNTITTTDADNGIVFNLADTTDDEDFIVDIQGTGNTFEIQDGGTAFVTFGDTGLSTFLDDVNLTFAGTENLAVTSDLAGAVDILSIIGTPSGTAAATRGILIEQASSTNTNGIDTAIDINNADDSVAIGTGLLIRSSGGGAITTGIDLTATQIGTGVNLGANDITGTSAVIDFSDFDVASTGQVTISDTTDITTPAGEDLTLLAGTTGVIDLNDTVRIPTLDGTAGTTSLCRNASNLLAGCGSNPDSVTLQQAYVAGNTITTVEGEGDVSITLADTTTDHDFIVNAVTANNIFQLQANASPVFTFDGNGLTAIADDVDLTFGGSENLTITSDGVGGTSDSLALTVTPSATAGTLRGIVLSQASSTNAEPLDTAIEVNNADDSAAIGTGLLIQSTGGGAITTGITLTDTDIGTGIDLGTNDIVGTSAVINFSDFDVASTGQVTISDTTDITTPSGEHLTLTAAGAGNIELSDTVDVGANTIQGTAAVINFSDFDVASTGQVTLSDTTDLTTPAGEDLTLLAGTTGVIDLNDTVRIPTLDGTAGSTALCRNASNLLAGCTANANGVTLQQAYEAGNTINATTAEGAIAFTLTSADFTTTIADSSSNVVSISRANGAGTADPAQLLLLDNLDLDRAVPIGLKIQSAAGTITTAIDLTDTEIGTGIALGANDITGTSAVINFDNFDVTTTGQVIIGDDTTDITTPSGENLTLVAAGAGVIQLSDSVDVGANTIQGTAAIIDFSDFDVASTGQVTVSDTTDLTTPAGENLTLSAGTTGVIELADTVDVGANTIQGTTAVINFSDFDVASTGQVTISDTTDITTPAGEDLTFLAGTTGVIDLNDTVRIPTLDGTAGSTLLCRNASNLLATCSSNPSGVTLQQAYEAGNTINATTGEGAIAFTLTSADFTTTVADGSSNVVSISRANGAGVVDPAQLLLLDNLDLDRAVPIGLKIQAAAGTITTAIDLTDTEIGTGIALGANDITGTSAVINFDNFDVATTGGITIGDDTTDITTPAGEDLTLLAGTTGVIDLNDTVRIPTLDGTAGTTSLCRNASNLLAGCGSNPDSVTLQQAYVAGNTITTVEGEGDVSITLADTTTDHDFIINAVTANNIFQLQANASPVLTFDGNGLTAIADDVDLTFGGTENLAISSDGVGGTSDSVTLTITPSATAGTLRGIVLTQASSTNTEPLDTAIEINNGDDSAAIGTGLLIQSTGGGSITTGINLSATQIGTGISLGANDITGTSAVIDFSDFDVASTGQVTISDTTDLTTPAGEDLTINSGTTGTIAIGDDAQAETINVGTGGAAKSVFLGSTNSTSTTTVQSGSGNINLQANSTATGNVQIGDGGAASATPDLLVVDVGSAEPTGTNGAMYYSTAGGGKFRCFEGGAWKDCDTTGGTTTLQSAYNASTSPEITLDATRGALTIRDNATPIGANLLEVQDNAGTTTYLAVTSSATTLDGNLAFGNAANRTISINTSGGDTVGRNLTVSAGTAGGATTGAAGGSLTLQGGNAAGSGNNAGGDVFVFGGTATGTGAVGDTILAHTGSAAQGLVGIRTNAPGGVLHIAENDSDTELVVGEDLWTTNDNLARIALGNSNANSTFRIGQGSTGYGYLAWIYDATEANGYLSLTSNSNHLRLQDGGLNVYVGASVADDTGQLFILDTKTGASDPVTGINGGMYYNSNAGVNKFRCYEGGTWKDCIGTAGASTLQQAYEAGNTITTTDADNGIIFNLADTTDDEDFIVNIQGTGNTFEIQDGGTAFVTFADTGLTTIVDDVDLTFGGSENLNISSDGVGGSSDSVTLTITPSATAGTLRGIVLTQASSTNAEPLDTAIEINNADDSAAIGTGLLIQSTGGGAITTGINLSATQIGTGINLGANDITGTTAEINFSNFDVLSTGQAVFTGVATDITTASGESLTLEGAGAGEVIVNDTLQVATLGGTTGAVGICRNSSNQISSCGSNPDSVTLQQAYDAGNTITSAAFSGGRDIEITLADTTTDSTFEITQAGTATAFRVNDDGTFTDSSPFIITERGLLGIGVIPKSWGTNSSTVQVGGVASFNANESVLAGAVFHVTNNAYFDGTNWRYINGDEASQWSQFDGLHRWRITGAGAAEGVITWTDAMVLSNAGNLDVVGSLTAGTSDAFVVSTAGTVTIAAGQSYTGAGAVTLSSAAGADLNLNSASGTILGASGDDIRLQGTGDFLVAAGQGLDTNAAGTLNIGTTNANLVALNTDTNFTFAGTENLTITSDGVGGTSDSVTLTVTPSATAGTLRGLTISQASSTNTEPLDAGLYINNADDSAAIGAAIQIANTGGGNYTAIFDILGTTLSATEINVLDAEITLGTETAGNYVDNVTGGAGITVTGSAGEGWEPDVTLDLLDAQDGTSGTTFSFSGLEFQGASSDEVTLLQGCADGQILKWDDEVGGNGRWDCAADSSGGAGSLQAAYDGGNTITSAGYTGGRDIEITFTDETTDSTFEIYQAGTAAAFRVNDETGFTDTTPFVISDTGTVGIQTASPAAVLHIAKNASDDELVIGDDVITANNGTSWLALANNAANSSFNIGQSATANAYLVWNYNATESSANFQISTIAAANYLGIQQQGGFTAVGDGAGTGFTPAAMLHVSSDNAQPLFRVTDATASAIDVMNIADEGAVIFRNRTDSTTAFQIRDSGNISIFDADTSGQGRIGIGDITAPLATLHVQSRSTSTDPLFRVTDGTATAVDVINVADEGATTFKNRTNSTTAFQVEPSGSTTPVLNVDTTNLRVGVGTESAADKLHVAGFIRTDTTAWAQSYDGSLIVQSSAVFNSKLYVGVEGAAGDGNILVFDGTSWNTAYDGTVDGVHALAVFNGKLYAGIGSGTGEGDVIVCNPVSAGDGATCDDAADWTESRNGDQSIRSMAVYNGRLYVGQSGALGDGDIFVCNPAGGGDTLTCDNAADWSTSRNGDQERIQSLATYNGKLYAGQGTSDTDGDIFVFDGANWSTSYDGGADYILGLAVYNGKLYAGQGNDATEGDVLVFDGTSWTTSYNGSAESIIALATYNGKLFAGQGSTAGNGDVLVFDGFNWRNSYEGSSTQIWRLEVYNGKLFEGDVNGDVFVYNERLEDQLEKTFDPGETTPIGEQIQNFAKTVTFLTDVDAVLNAAENIAITSDLAGSVDVVTIIGTPSATAGTTRGFLLQQASSTNTNGLDTAMEIDNADNDVTIATGILIRSTGGGAITTGIDVSATAIGTALSVGDNTVQGGALTVQGSTTAAFTAQAGNVTITATGAGNDIILSPTDLVTISGNGLQVSTITSSGDLSIHAASGSDLLLGSVNVTDIVRVGDGTNNITFAATSRKVSYAGSARQDTKLTLRPEFDGAVLTPDGGANSGTMTSDFCGNDGAGSFVDVNAAVCNTATEFHNYYNWTSNGANDYDVWIRWQVPSNFSAFAASNPIQFYSKKSATGDDVQMAIFTTTGAACGTATSMTNTASAWQLTTYTSSGCSPSAGDVLSIKVHMAVAANGNTVQMGEIIINYLASF